MPGPAKFLPSQNGFAFTNTWPAEPAIQVPTAFGTIDIGNAAAGLCGGMVYAALDYWHAGLTPPASRPAPGDPLYRYIVRRLIDSWHIPAGVAQYYLWMTLPDGDAAFSVFGLNVVMSRGRAWRTIEEQWPLILADLTHGVPVTLGLVTVASASPAELRLNHQVTVYDYRTAADQVTILVYDPNSGQRDDVYIRFSPADPTRPTPFEHNLALDRPVRGFFRTAYCPAGPPG